MIKTALLILLLSCSLQNIAQNKIKFHSQNYLGVLDNSSGTNFQLQSINGFQWNTWFAGIGTGIDYHYFKTIPLFLSATKFLCPCERAFFVSGNIGTNFLWDKNTQTSDNGFRRGDFRPSLFWEGGFGYKVGLNKNRDALLLNLGYSYKEMKEKILTTGFCQFPPCPVLYDRYQYRLNRLSLKVGWQF